jgi:heat shock protein HslJ
MPEITGIDWRLIQMNASAAVPAEMTARPWIRLDAATRRVTGNFGCNTANGTYTSGINQTLHFGAIATTRRACTDDRMNAQETALGAAMGSVDRYRVIADTLDLLQGDKVLARFRRSP